MKIGQASGFQVAFLIYAVMLLAVPLANFLIERAFLEGAWRTLVQKGTHFALAIVLIASLPPLRQFAVAALARPIPTNRRLELTLVGLLKLAQAFAAIGAL